MVNSTPTTRVLKGPDEAMLFPFGQKAAQRLQDLCPGHLAAMLCAPGHKPLTDWMYSFSAVCEAADRLIAELGRDSVRLFLAETLR